MIRDLARLDAARLKRRRVINVGDLASQAKVGEDEFVIWLGQHVLLPAAIGAQIDADLLAVLPYRQDARARFVQLVNFALAFDEGAITRRDDLRRQIEAVSIMPI